MKHMVQIGSKKEAGPTAIRLKNLKRKNNLKKLACQYFFLALSLFG
jgi:hypothetical protein